MNPQESQTGGTAGPIDAPSTRRRYLIWSAIGLVVVAAIILFARWRAGAQVLPAGGRFAGAALTVGVAKVTTGDVPITINALGTVTPLATVTVHPQVTGPLVKIAFTEGQTIKAGDLLVQIDPRPFQASLDQAAGQLKRDQALLANAKVDSERYKTLLAQNSVSDQTYATQVATVAQDEAVVASDQAALEAAQLNLSYTRITSPVTGLVGLRQVDVGNLMQANSTSIVLVTQVQPMSVLFTLPEDSLGNILQRLREGQKLMVDAYDRSLSSKIASGVLSNADNEIDPTTGTLKLRAMFDNSRFELFPNQFVNVRLLVDTIHNAIVVPGAAMQQGASGSYVYVVADNSTVKMRAVKTGPSNGDQMSVTDGLQPGETVVVDGADQLRDGARVILPGAAPPDSSAFGQGQRARRRPGADGSSSGGFPGAGTSSGGHFRRPQGASSGASPSSGQ
ncbi:MAG TPA: efflux RND transporter periplasmic adaptor subunit [Steroidobacteraceae bacterium]|jgi:multidrug efflux system membrane fusion protein|nr:efflux RND transporter periplasmic adaptor subunit [Steroidobacteraceae bacterium]